MDGFTVVSRSRRKSSSRFPKPSYKQKSKPTLSADERIWRDQDAMMQRASTLSNELDARIMDAFDDSPYEMARLVDLPEGITEHEIEYVKEVYQMRPWFKFAHNNDTLMIVHTENDGGELRLESAVYAALKKYWYGTAWIVDVPGDVTDTAMGRVRTTLRVDGYSSTLSDDKTFLSVSRF